MNISVLINVEKSSIQIEFGILKKMVGIIIDKKIWIALLLCETILFALIYGWLIHIERYLRKLKKNGR